MLSCCRITSYNVCYTKLLRATLAEAGAVTGFELNVPAAPAEYPDMTIQVMNQSMIEVIFTNKANETEAGQDEA